MDFPQLTLVDDYFNTRNPTCQVNAEARSFPSINIPKLTRIKGPLQFSLPATDFLAPMLESVGSIRVFPENPTTWPRLVRELNFPALIRIEGDNLFNGLRMQVIGYEKGSSELEIILRAPNLEYAGFIDFRLIDLRELVLPKLKSADLFIQVNALNCCTDCNLCQRLLLMT